MEEKRNASRIRMHEKETEKNVFREEHEARFSMSKGAKTLCVLGAVTFLSFLVCISFPNGMDVNNVHISAAWWTDTFINNISELADLITGQGSTMTPIVCQYLVAILAGAALSLTGTVYQGALKNGLASPTTLGVQTGGVLGGTFYVVFLMEESKIGWEYYSDVIEKNSQMSFFEKYEESFFILIGCVVTVAFVIGVTKMAGKGKIKTFNLILTGMVTGSVISGAIGLFQYWMLMYDTYGEKTYELRFMMMGTLSRISRPEHVIMMGVPVLAGIVFILAFSAKLNALVFSEDEARSMGVRVDFLRNMLVLVVTCLVALVISFCGQISFLGFIVPHMARRITGPDFRYLIPGGAMLGAIVLMWVYFFGMLTGYSDNLNFMMSIIGGGIFLFMLIRYRRRSNADWA